MTEYSGKTLDMLANHEFSLFSTFEERLRSCTIKDLGLILRHIIGTLLATAPNVHKKKKMLTFKGRRACGSHILTYLLFGNVRSWIFNHQNALIQHNSGTPSFICI